MSPRKKSKPTDEHTTTTKKATVRTLEPKAPAVTRAPRAAPPKEASEQPAARRVEVFASHQMTTPRAMHHGAHLLDEMRICGGGGTVTITKADDGEPVVTCS